MGHLWGTRPRDTTLVATFVPLVTKAARQFLTEQVNDRLWLDRSRKYLDENKVETRVPIDDVVGIYQHAGHLRGTVARYLTTATDGDPAESPTRCSRPETALLPHGSARGAARAAGHYGDQPEDTEYRDNTVLYLLARGRGVAGTAAQAAFAHGRWCARAPCDQQHNGGCGGQSESGHGGHVGRVP